MYRGLPKFLLSIQNWYPRCPKLSKSPPTFNKLYDVCPAYWWEICFLCFLSLKDVPLSICRSFIDSRFTDHGTLLMAMWSLGVFVKLAELINWCLHNGTFSCDTRKYWVAQVQNIDCWTRKIFDVGNCPGCAIYSKTSWQPYQFQHLTNTQRMHEK